MSKFKFSAVATNEAFKVLVGKGEAGDLMQAHLSDKEAFLSVRTGEIAFRLGTKTEQYSAGASIQIPAGKIHAFEVLEACELQLILNAKAKLSFVEKVE